MCGISGFFFSERAPLVDGSSPVQLIEKMGAVLQHRGPDQQGTFIDEKENLFLVHQRLSIIDLSDAGLQPMKSHSERYVVAFNGEIYNFQDLRSELNNIYPNMFWRGHSDTEVLLELIEHYGIERALVKLNGMFAFVLYDLKENSVIFARDRFGEKPLYINSNSRSFSFSSELKSIELFNKNLTLNNNAVAAQLRFSYIPAPFTIYEEVFKLMPGHYLRVNLSNYNKFAANDSVAYWSASQSINSSINMRSQFSTIAESIDETERVLRRSISQRMVSDVPLGAFLSGGIDSTCIAALMQEEASQKIKTFSIGFRDKEYNEAEHAKTISNILDTEHHELYIDAKDMLEYVPRLAEFYDEPFSDSSQLPTLKVAEFAKKHVTVALTGDSGDELFCGYNRYIWAPKITKKFSRIPLPIRSMSAYLMTSVSNGAYNKFAYIFSSLIPKLKTFNSIGDKIYKLASVLNFTSEYDLYQKLIMTWPESVVNFETYDISATIKEIFDHADLNFAEKMMWQDTIGYMQNDILTKVDRAGMAMSLETRVPFLDNDVFQHAWTLPPEFKLHNGESKYPLRQIISKYVPQDIMDKPKTGFGVPIHNWLRVELRDWAENLLNEKALGVSGVLNVNLIRKTWLEHLKGKRNFQYALWNVLMFQQWYMKSKVRQFND